jgi:WD40 repeat protein
VEWDPLERKLASGGHDGHVRLWDPKTGKPLGDAMKGHSKWVTSLAWEPLHLCVVVYGVSQRYSLLTYQKPIYPTVGILV